jgi:hypothetical protein
LREMRYGYGTITLPEGFVLTCTEYEYCRNT